MYNDLGSICDLTINLINKTENMFKRVSMMKRDNPKAYKSFKEGQRLNRLNSTTRKPSDGK